MVATVNKIPPVGLPMVTQAGTISPIWYEFFRSFAKSVVESSIFNTTDFTVASEITVNDAGIDHDATTNFVANEHIDWTAATDNLVTSGTLQADGFLLSGSTISTTATNDSMNLIPNGSGTVNIFGYGAEENGININGTTYTNGFRINDIGGSIDGMLHLHRHSTSLPTSIIGSRSNSADSTHGTVTANQVLFRIDGAGWTGSHYDLFGNIRFKASSSGSISATSSPGAITFNTTPTGSNTPALALTIDQDKSATFVGNIKKSVEASITASTTQTQGQQPLTKDINEVSICANVNDVVTLPTAAAGLVISVINNGAQTLQIFPASGDNLGAGVNTSTTLASGSNITYAAYDTTNWESV